MHRYRASNYILWGLKRSNAQKRLIIRGLKVLIRTRVSSGLVHSYILINILYIVLYIILHLTLYFYFIFINFIYTHFFRNFA
jgi:hypothetical protein